MLIFVNVSLRFIEDFCLLSKVENTPSRSFFFPLEKKFLQICCSDPNKTCSFTEIFSISACSCLQSGSLSVWTSGSKTDLSDIKLVMLKMSGGDVTFVFTDLAAMYNMWLMRNNLWKSRPRRSVSLSWSKPWKPGNWYDSAERDNTEHTKTIKDGR